MHTIGTPSLVVASLLGVSLLGACADVAGGDASSPTTSAPPRFAQVESALVATSSQCYVASNDSGLLYVVQRGDADPGRNTTTIGATGLDSLRSLAFDAEEGVLYAVAADRAGVLDIDSGAWSVGDRLTFGTGLGALGVRTFDDVEAIAWNPVNGVLWAADHDDDDGDALFQVDAATGRFRSGAFGTGVDYLPVPALGGATDVLDAAFDPRDGRLYLLLEHEAGARLASFRPSTREFRDIGSTGVDLRALSFDARGGLWGATGNSGVLYAVDVVSAGTSAGIPVGGALDIEGLACLVVPSADLSVRMTATPADPGPLDLVEIGVVVTNDGPMDAPEVSLTIPVPDTTSYGSSAASRGTFAPRSSVWTIGDLASGADATLSLFLSVNPGTVGSTIVVASDTIASASVDHDPSDNRSSAAFTVSATGPGGLSPVAADDTASTDEDTGVFIDVLANDRDPEGAELTLVAVSAPTLGTASIVDATIFFVPPPGESGTATFRYTVRDPGGNIASAGVTVVVVSVPDPPTAVDDAAETDEDGPVFIEVLDNDFDTDGEFIYIVRTNPSDGASAGIQPDGRIRYAPAPDFEGTDRFTYTVTDPTRREDTATVTVTVEGAEDAPHAVDDGFVVPADQASELDVLANDSDPEGLALRVARVEAPEHGSATVGEGGAVVYEPEAGYRGLDAFTYAVTDPGGLEATATARITVGQANRAPVAADDFVSTSPSVPIDIGPLTNDTDPDGDALVIVSAGPSPNGVLLLLGDDTLRYAPRGEVVGEERIPYVVRDAGGLTDIGEIVVTVAVRPGAPRAYDDDAATRASELVNIDVLANDSAPAGALRLVDLGGPRGGTASIEGSEVRYAPRAGFVGVDQFTYTAEDAALQRATATVVVRVAGGSPVLNTEPIARDDEAQTTEDEAVLIDVLGNDADFDGDPLDVVALSSPRQGTAVAEGDLVRYTPFPDVAGTDSFTYTIDDGRGGRDSATVTVTVEAVNDAPVAVDDRATTEVGRSVAVEVLRNDRDAEGDELSVASVGEPENGEVSVGFAGTILYTPADGFSGVDEVTYRISDGVDEAGAVLRIDVGAGVDSDGDGLSDAEEALIGTDPGDGDSDDDGILDGSEGAYDEDRDGDGLVAALDPDSDDDGVLDGTEAGLTQPDRDTDTVAGHFVPDADPNTTTDPLLADSDDGGVRDGAEDTNHNGRVDAGELDPGDPADDVMPSDRDGDGLSDGEETLVGTDPDDADSDDDGVGDGDEPNWHVDGDGDGLVGAMDADSDDDGVLDGTELGVTVAGEGTDEAAGTFVADADESTTTSALLRDSDGGGREDGVEDANQNGAVDPGETDPNDPADDFDTPTPDLGPDAGDAGGEADLAARAEGGLAGGAGCGVAAPRAARGSGPLGVLVGLLVGLAVIRRTRSRRPPGS
jgi:hypothetical protein